MTEPELEKWIPKVGLRFRTPDDAWHSVALLLVQFGAEFGANSSL
jgi:hypothetical protein